MKIAYCISCGNRFPKEALFCPYCGTKIYNPDEDQTLDNVKLMRDTPDENLEFVSEENTVTTDDSTTIKEPVVEPNVDEPDTEVEVEKPLTGVCIISACFPMLGFIIALCNIGSNKKKAKVYALCALGGFSFAFLSGVLQAL